MNENTLEQLLFVSVSLNILGWLLMFLSACNDNNITLAVLLAALLVSSAVLSYWIIKKESDE